MLEDLKQEVYEANMHPSTRFSYFTWGNVRDWSIKAFSSLNHRGWL